MAKARRSAKRWRDRQRRRIEVDRMGDWLEVGHGDYATVTIPRDGSRPVVQRFETEAEMNEQHRKNLSEDRPLVGYEGMN